MRARRLAAALLLALCAGATLAAGPAEVNEADQAALESVRGVGTVMSEHILAARRDGPFKDWADLIRRVPGIGPRSAAKLSAAGLRVGGLPYAAPAAPAGAASPP